MAIDPDTARKLRTATEDDVTAALKDSYAELPLSTPVDALEFFNRMLDQMLGEGVGEDE